MKCFTWKTRSCEGTKEVCHLVNNSKNEEARPISENNDTTKDLFSPVFEGPGRSARYFCLYNVSLNCPGNAVMIEKMDLTTWPSQDANDCSNYVNFYTNQRSEGLPHRYCDSNAIFSRRLESSSFLAIMWNSENVNNSGVFQFRATCADPDPMQPPVTSSSDSAQPPATGSGDADQVNERRRTMCKLRHRRRRRSSNRGTRPQSSIGMRPLPHS